MEVLKFLAILTFGIFLGLTICYINESQDIKNIKRYTNEHVDSIIYVIGYDYRLQKEDKLSECRISNNIRCITFPDKSKFVNYKNRVYHLPLLEK